MTPLELFAAAADAQTAETAVLSAVRNQSTTTVSVKR